MVEPGMMSLTSPLPPQSHRIAIRWSQSAIKNFQLVDRAIRELTNWLSVWSSWGAKAAGVRSPTEIISANIKRNLDQGIDPETKTWAPLSLGYARRVGRGRMMFGPMSDVYAAYVDNPDVSVSKNLLVYQPNMAFHRAYYSWLRSGYTTRRGTTVPGREWFGLSRDYKEEMNHAMARITQVIMNKGYETGVI